MKKLLIALLLLPSLAWGTDYARMSPVMMGGVATPPASSTPEYVQSKTAYPSSAPTLDSGATAGNLLVTLICGHNTTDTSISGSCSSSWVKLTHAYTTNTGGELYYCDNASSGTVNITVTNMPLDGGWSVHEYTAGTLDTETAVANSNDDPTTGNITSSTNVLLVGYLCNESINQNPTASGWTARTVSTAHYHWTWEKSGSAGSNALNTTTIGGSEQTILGIAGFKAK